MTTNDFSTLRTADLLDNLVSAVDRARVNAQDDPRWLRAIDAGWDWLLQQDELSYNAATHELVVQSATGSGEYRANGACQCRAAELDRPCWHRAAARIVRRAVELAQFDAMSAAATAAEQAHEDAEVNALAQELLNEARRGGCAWYTFDVALAGARSRMAELLNYAAEWDIAAAATRPARGMARAA